MDRRAFVAATAFATFIAGTTMGAAAEIKLLSTNGIRAVTLALVPEFERATGHKVVVHFAPSHLLAKRIADGETADVVLLTRGALDEVTGLGKVVPGSRVDLARSGVGVAVKAGTPKPDISTADSLKQALLGAKSVAYSKGASGVHVAKLVERLGLTEALKQKTRFVSGEPVGAVLARGEAEIGFQQISELLPVAGIQYVGPLPGDLQNMTTFAAGLTAGAKETEAAQALIKFMAAPAALPVIKHKGMEPAG